MTQAIRILLVEDDDAAREGFRAALELAGFIVETCDDGADGLARIIQEPGAFHAIVTDLNLPSVSGAEMIAKAGPALGKAAVVYLSGYSADNIVPGATVLAKPISKDDLVKAVRAAAN
jgi:two-component system, cell cycle sensor histidine kinase and response regulator CckA